MFLQDSYLAFSISKATLAAAERTQKWRPVGLPAQDLPSLFLANTRSVVNKLDKVCGTILEKIVRKSLQSSPYK